MCCTYLTIITAVLRVFAVIFRAHCLAISVVPTCTFLPFECFHFLHTSPLASVVFCHYFSLLCFKQSEGWTWICQSGLFDDWSLNICHFYALQFLACAQNYLKCITENMICRKLSESHVSRLFFSPHVTITPCPPDYAPPPTSHAQAVFLLLFCFLLSKAVGGSGASFCYPQYAF